MRAGLMSSTVMLTVVGAAVLLAAPPTKSISATAEFGADSGEAVTLTSGGSSASLAGSIVSGIFDGSVVPSAGLVLTMNLAGLQPFEPPYLRECEVPGILASCNPAGPFPEVGSLDLSDVNIRVKALVRESQTEWVDFPGGLTGMACGEPGPALVNYTFYIDGTEGHWGMNANPRYHVDAAQIVRTSKTAWVVTASEAELVSFNHSGIRRKAGPSHEGVYDLPFQLNIIAQTAPTAPNCPSA